MPSGYNRRAAATREGKGRSYPRPPAQRAAAAWGSRGQARPHPGTAQGDIRQRIPAVFAKGRRRRPAPSARGSGRGHGRVRGRRRRRRLPRSIVKGFGPVGTKARAVGSSRQRRRVLTRVTVRQHSNSRSELGSRGPGAAWTPTTPTWRAGGLAEKYRVLRDSLMQWPPRGKSYLPAQAEGSMPEA